ncbi:MAG: serine hydrolase, partial [Bacteroidetes bacterium]|nr:serine hydrolase [Bacteroidota bacterium]
FSRTYNTRRSKHEKIPNYAYGFVYSDSLKVLVIPDSIPKYDVVRYLDGVQGDGTVNSTTGDLLKWDRALKNHTLLSESTQNEMFSKQYPVFGGYAHYGYGVMLNQDQLGSSIGHSGSWPGYSHYMTRYIDTDITIIVLCNKAGSPATVTSGLAQILHDKPIAFPYFHKETVIDTSLIKKYTGKYFFPSSGPVDIWEKNGQLFLSIYGGRIVECKPESNNKFFYHDPINRSVATIEYETDDAGTISKVYHTMNYVKAEIKKR